MLLEVRTQNHDYKLYQNYWDISSVIRTIIRVWCDETKLCGGSNGYHTLIHALSFNVPKEVSVRNPTAPMSGPKLRSYHG